MGLVAALPWLVIPERAVVPCVDWPPPWLAGVVSVNRGGRPFVVQHPVAVLLLPPLRPLLALVVPVVLVLQDRRALR